MQIYRLTPLSAHDPSWHASVHREVAIVRAESEALARSLALKAFKTTLLRPAPGRAIAIGPWGRRETVRAEVIEDPRYSSRGLAAVLEPWGYS